MALARQHLIASMLFVFLAPSPAMRMQKSAVAQQERAKWCWLSNSNQLKDYYFEGMFDLPDSEDHTALQLWRDPERPVLRIHKVSQWVVRTPPKDKDADPNKDLPWTPDVQDPELMEWLPACMKDGSQDECKPEDVVEIDLMNVSYISLTPEMDITNPSTGETTQEMGLKIVFPDESVTEFVGGVYMPRVLMMSAMQRAEEDYGKFSGLGQEARDHASESDNMLNSALYAFRNTVSNSISTGTGSGAAAGISVGLGVSASILMIGAPGLGGFGLATILAGAGAGLAGGTAAGLALGAALGTVIGGGAALWDYHKQKTELGYSAVDKLWEKFECHNKFVHCNKTFIVPQGKTCPEA